MNRTKLTDFFTWVVFLLSSAAIVAAARGDLWLDEIWSLSFANEAESITDILVRFPYSNNHPLNTIFLHCIGEQKVLLLHRVLSIVSGLGSLLLIRYAARRNWGHAESLCSMVLLGTSYPLLLYFSEARGYAPAILFGLAAYTALSLNPVRRRWLQYSLFWMCSVLGIFAHASFIMLSLSFILWDAARRILQPGARLGQCVWQIVVLHLPPLLFLAWWYVFFLKDLVIGGGPVYSLWSVIGQSSVLVMGIPDVPALRVAASVLVLLLVVLGVALLRRQGDMQWLFSPVVLIVSPGVLLVMVRPELLYVRFFIVCFPFFCLLFAYLIVRGFRSSQRYRRWLALGLLIGIVAGQMPRDFLLLKLGRGQYAAALSFIAEQSPGRRVLVGSDHDFRNHPLFKFYTKRVAGGENLRYVTQPEWKNEPPDWVFISSQELSFEAPKEIMFYETGKSYRLVKDYRFSGVSGWSWFLFKRVG